MTEYPEIAARFARDTAHHEMLVLHDDDLYRHLRFSRSRRGYGEYWFDLITWPGCLTIRGDYGDAYTFARERDMFPFFRSRRSDEINPHYWAQKLDGHRQSATEYSEAVFRQIVGELFVDAVRGGYAPRGLGKAVRADILDQDLNDEGEARKLLEGFEFGGGYRAECATCKTGTDVTSYSSGLSWELSHKGSTSSSHRTGTRRVEGFTFSDTWEFSFRDYEPTFLWACHAIAWGIGRYTKVAGYGLTSLAIVDRPVDAVREERCLREPDGCGKPLVGEDGEARVFWDADEAARYEAKWRTTGLCPDCQDRSTAKEA